MKRSFDSILNIVSNYPDLSNKTVIVTGGTSGIGFSLCKIVVIKHGDLVIAARDEKKALDAKSDLLKIDKNARIQIEVLDQSSFASIDKFATIVQMKYPAFDSIIINAGVYRPVKGLLTDKGLPLTSGTNLFGAVYLAERLRKVIDGSKPHKIIFQGSAAARFSKYKDYEPDFLDAYANKDRQYNMSKLGLYNMFLHYVKAERSNFTYALAEPGICGSDIVRNYPLLVKGLAKFGMNLLFQTPLQGSLSAAYLMTHEIDNGDYVVPNGLFAFSGVPKKRKLSEKKAIYSLPYKILTTIYDK